MKIEKLPAAKEDQTLGRGLVFSRFFTKSGVHPLDEVKYVKRTSVITNPDGSVVFKMENVEVPESWSQLATDIIVSKYFRKAGVPGTGSEVSARQVVTRIAHSIRVAGEKFVPVPDPNLKRRASFLIRSKMDIRLSSTDWIKQAEHCGLE